MRFPHHGLNRSLTQLGLCAVLGLLLGALLGLPGWGLASGLAGWIMLQVRQARRLEAWMADTSQAAEVRGIWEDIHAEMARRRRRARKRRDRLMRRLRRSQQITEALPDAVILCSPLGDIEWFNSAAQSLARLTPGDVGNNLSNLLRDPKVAALFQPGVSNGLVDVPSPFETNTTLEVRMFPDETGHRVVMLRDTTDLRRMLTMRQDFVANVSHELRTPLTVMVGYLESMAAVDGPPVPDAVDLAERLRSPVLRMKALVDDLLLLSRLEGRPERSSADNAPVAVASLVAGLVRDAEQLSEGAHLFDCDLDPNLQVKGTLQELHSAFDNLLTNAVRYSPDGGTVAVRWQAGADGSARFSVTDQGIGIAPAHMDRLTERFYRVDLGRSRARGGTGLGLAIVKHVLRRHDSNLDITSALGKGSTFSCTFPTARIERADSTTAEQNNVALLHPDRSGNRPVADTSKP